jgi:hypothetical protein
VGIGKAWLRVEAGWDHEEDGLGAGEGLCECVRIGNVGDGNFASEGGPGRTLGWVAQHGANGLVLTEQLTGCLASYFSGDTCDCDHAELDERRRGEASR